MALGNGARVRMLEEYKQDGRGERILRKNNSAAGFRGMRLWCSHISHVAYWIEDKSVLAASRCTRTLGSPTSRRRHIAGTGQPLPSPPAHPRATTAKRTPSSARPRLPTMWVPSATSPICGSNCRIRCIYSTTGVLNAQRRPRKRRLAMHWIKRLNSTAGFEIPIKQAVDLCLSLHDRLIQENGAANVDMCVLQTQLHYCIEENVGRIVAVVDAVVKVVDIVVFVTEDMAVVAGQSCDSQL
ncbi:Protein of unknown function [Gryllus bimaculatus]|nr:Protein of unknown function [Gryllus bimaculatus]